MTVERENITELKKFNDVSLPYISDERLNRIHRENSMSLYKGLLLLLAILSVEHFFLYSLYGVLGIFPSKKT